MLVLVIVLVVLESSVTLIWFMNQQQTRAGMRYRSDIAMALAEAGVHRVLSILESTAPDGSPGRAWHVAAYSEALQVGPFDGRFTVSLERAADRAILVTSAGEVDGAVRRLRARIYLASPALLVALYGNGSVSLGGPPATTIILPYGAGFGDRPWFHIAAGREIWFATDVSVNDPSVTFAASPGPVDALQASNSHIALPRPAPVRLLLASNGKLMLAGEHLPATTQQLRMMGASIGKVVLSQEALPRPPGIDRTHYRSLAAANTANASINEAAGRYMADADLARKRDGLYSPGQFKRILAYFKTGFMRARLRGVIYVTGGIVIDGSHRLEIVEGTLVAEGSVHIGPGMTLEITRSAVTRSLPGLLVVGYSDLAVAEGASLRVHGLVFVNSVIEIDSSAHMEVVGSVLANSADESFLNFGATVLIRYDPAVLGTPGLLLPLESPITIWVASWEELQ